VNEVEQFCQALLAMHRVWQQSADPQYAILQFGRFLQFQSLEFPLGSLYPRSCINSDRWGS
jgi:hypothetical protein